MCFLNVIHKKQKNLQRRLFGRTRVHSKRISATGDMIREVCGDQATRLQLKWKSESSALDLSPRGFATIVGYAVIVGGI